LVDLMDEHWAELSVVWSAAHWAQSLAANWEHWSVDVTAGSTAERWVYLRADR